MGMPKDAPREMIPPFALPLSHPRPFLRAFRDAFHDTGKRRSRGDNMNHGNHAREFRFRGRAETMTSNDATWDTIEAPKKRSQECKVTRGQHIAA